MENILTILCCAFFIAIFAYRIIKELYLYKKYNVELFASIKNIEKHNSESEYTHTITVEYIFQGETYISSFDSVLYKSFNMGEKITISVSPISPTSIRYWGRRKGIFYRDLAVMIIAIGSFIFWILHYLKK